MNKILIIEDEDILRRDLHEMLSLEGFQVQSASNGLEGLEKVQGDLPDLIICDIRMPGLDGYQVLKAVRDLPNGYKAVFIFLTAKVETEDIRAGMNLGADDYLLKPVTRKDLMTAVKVRLAHRQQMLEALRKQSGEAPASHNGTEFDEESVKSMLAQLSKTEKKVFFYVAQEKSTAEIATLLYVSPKTVENHRHNISKKLKLKGGHSVLALALKTKPILSRILPN
jgi:DNA-binding NarL/FixJ family response regulator